MRNQPVYSIGIVSDLVGVPADTIRVWEKAGIIPHPQRRSGKRFYSELELRQLQFVCNLSREGLSVRAMLYYLRLYPCWKTVNCPGCLQNGHQDSGAKPCWREEGTFCKVTNMKNPCASCSTEGEQKPYETEGGEIEVTRVNKNSTLEKSRQ